MGWRTFSGKPLEDIYKAVEQTLDRETRAGHKIKVCIGSDSEVRGKRIEYATVIVFLREGKGGFMFVQNQSERGPISIKERMLLEVAKSIDIAYNLCSLFDKYDIDLEVHADINTNPQFKSNPALSEAMGYIVSMGFSFKAKPDAFASSSCADKLV